MSLKEATQDVSSKALQPPCRKTGQHHIIKFYGIGWCTWCGTTVAEGDTVSAEGAVRACTKAGGGKHEFRELHREQASANVDAVVHWCVRCGGFVVDRESDNRVLPGPLLAMRWPEFRLSNGTWRKAA